MHHRKSVPAARVFTNTASQTPPRALLQGAPLDLPPPDLASQLGELFSRGSLTPSAAKAAAGR